ncbi:MAG TPA: hypothetical protein VJ953_19865 [Saprospiraceae bacterium]|nr:hypothetical protein [Saprospiraceae bacterium]
MENLEEEKKRLKEGLGKKGITYVLKYLKGILPADVPKYDVVIQIESEYRSVKMKMLEGLLGHEEIEQANARIRRRLIDLVNSLEPKDFTSDAGGSNFEENREIKKGHVLYQVPETMQLNEDTRCLVRIAFDKVMLVEDIDLDENTEFRADVRISDYMKVEIIDPSAEPVFVIRSTSEPIQFIDQDTFTEWRFYVKPLKAGKHTLELKINVILQINDREVVREKTLEESIVIVAEAVADAPAVFKELDETFLADAESAPADEALPFTPPPSPRITGQERTRSKGQSQPTAPQPAPEPMPTAKTSGLRKMAFSLVAILAVGSVVYATVPGISQQVDWALTNNVRQTEQSYTSFIRKYEQKLPTSEKLEVAYYKRAIVKDSPEALREYIEEHPKSRFQEEATWKLAERTKDPIDYLDYADKFQNTSHTQAAKEKIVANEDKILETVRQKRDTSAAKILEKYLRVVPERKQSQKIKPMIRDFQPIVRDTQIKTPIIRDLSPTIRRQRESNLDLQRKGN